MNTLIVSDVFEAYDDGRKGAFASDAAKTEAVSKRDEEGRARKGRVDSANRDRKPFQQAA